MHSPITYEDVIALKPEDLAEDLVLDLVQESPVVHHAMNMYWRGHLTFEQSLIYAVAFLTFTNMYVYNHLSAIPASVVFTAEDGKALASKVSRYLDDLQADE